MGSDPKPPDLFGFGAASNAMLVVLIVYVLGIIGYTGYEWWVGKWP